MSRSRQTTSAVRRNGEKAGEPLNLDFLPSLLGFNIRRAQIALWRDFAQSAAGEVRPGAFSVLILASANPGVAQIEIADELGIDKASVVALIDRLEAAGWVERRRSTEDRRRQGIFVTAAGAKACKTLRKQMLDHERKFVERYSARELKTLLTLLQRLHG